MLMLLLTRFVIMGGGSDGLGWNSGAVASGMSSSKWFCLKGGGGGGVDGEKITMT